MDVTLNQLRVFREVARQGHVTRAAEALFVSQPAVSRCLKDLERQVGIALLEPVGRRMLVTQAGRLLLEHAERVLTEIEVAERTLAGLKDGETGRLVLGASSTPGTYLLPEVLGEFRRAHPRVEVALEIADTRNVVARVLDGGLDLGLVGEAEFSSGIAVEELHRDALVLIISPRHPLAGKTYIQLADLRNETFILRGKGSSTREILERALSAQKFQPRSVLELGTTEAVKKAVSAGLGISFVSEFAIELECVADTLVSRSLGSLELRRGIHIVRRSSFSPPLLYQRFLAVLRGFPQRGRTAPPKP
jgi:DNA-binding transcriptional LysR family regulator